MVRTIFQKLGHILALLALIVGLALIGLAVYLLFFKEPVLPASQSLPPIINKAKPATTPKNPAAPKLPTPQ